MLPGAETGSTGTEYCKYKSINTVLNTLNLWMVHQALCETLRNLVTTISVETDTNWIKAEIVDDSDPPFHQQIVPKKVDRHQQILKRNN